MSRRQAHSRPQGGEKVASPTPNPTAWTPRSIIEALETSGPSHEALARSLLSLTVELAGRELYPWGSRYDRQPTELRNDVAQDVMLKLFSDRGRVLRAWQPQLGLSLRGFIKRVVRYHVLQLFRAEHRNPWRNAPTSPETLDVAERDPPSLLHQLWLWQVRDRLLEHESARGRLLYQAIFVEQRNGDQVAVEQGMTRDAVYQWRARFKRRAARILGQLRPSEFAEDSP